MARHMSNREKIVLQSVNSDWLLRARLYKFEPNLLDSFCSLCWKNDVVNCQTLLKSSSDYVQSFYYNDSINNRTANNIFSKSEWYPSLRTEDRIPDNNTIVIYKYFIRYLMASMNKPPNNITHNEWIRNTFILLYCLFMLTGLLSNALLVVALVKERAFSNITNLFVITLACSDIGQCVFNMPLQLHDDLKETNNFSESMCQIVHTLYALPLHLSCLTILLIAVDRYRIIVYPLLPRILPRCAILLIFGTIIFSIVNGVPVARFTTRNSVGQIYQSNESEKGYYCDEKWPSPELRLIYSVYIFIVLFAAPLLITAVLYFRIYWSLQKRTLGKRDNERSKRTNKILISIVLCFAVCWCPWTLWGLLLEIEKYTSNVSQRSNIQFFTSHCDVLLNSTLTPGCHKWLDIFHKLTERNTSRFLPTNYTKFIDLFLRLFATISASINPYLYGWLNEQVKDALHKCCVCIPRIVNGRNILSTSGRGAYHDSRKETRRKSEERNGDEIGLHLLKAENTTGYNEIHLLNICESVAKDELCTLKPFDWIETNHHAYALCAEKNQMPAVYAQSHDVVTCVDVHDVGTADGEKMNKHSFRQEETLATEEAGQIACKQNIEIPQSTVLINNVHQFSLPQEKINHIDQSQQNHEAESEKTEKSSRHRRYYLNEFISQMQQTDL